MRQTRAAVKVSLSDAALYSGTPERHVRDSARRGGGLDLVVLLEALQPVPEAYASAQQDRDDDDMHFVDEPGRCIR